MATSRAQFLKEFFKRGNKVGSVAPSGRFLIRKMLKGLDFQHASVVVELGPGEGCITRELIGKIGPETKLFVFEMNETFVAQFLDFQDPRVVVVCDSAENVGKYLAAQGITQVDYVISSLPLTLFPVELKTNIIGAVHGLLRPGGVLRQYQYSTTAMKLLKAFFGKVKLDYTPFNIPPAFVYSCTK